MDKDTTNTDGGNAPESQGGAAGGFEGSAAAEDAAAPRAGFCQDCGRPLTTQTARYVGGGVFCEPCLTARVTAGSPMGASRPGSSYPTYGPVADGQSAGGPVAGAVPGDEPRPTLAAILGFIPGVGAMYNGQFAKGIVHLAIFVLLTFVANNVSGLFWIFCWGWIFYMAFEAYHTAVARRDGLPLPNAFGFNDIGERMGFGRSWVGGAGAAPARPEGWASPAGSQGPGEGFQPASGGVSGGASGWVAPGTPVAPAVPYAAANPVQVGTAPAWTGYVAPTAFAASGRVVAPAGPAAAPPVAAPQPAEPAGGQGGGTWGPRPYTETFTGAEQGYAASATGRGFPAGALWLIGLGVLILVANLLPDWRMTEWWTPLFFAGLSVWVFVRRRRSRGRLLGALRLPIVLMVLAVMLALHAANLSISGGLTVSVLLIVFGGLMLLERLVGVSGRMTGFGYAARGSGYPAAGSGYDPAGPGAGWSGAAGANSPGVSVPGAGDAPARAEWVRPEGEVLQADLARSTKSGEDVPSSSQKEGGDGQQGGPPEGQGSR